MKSYKPLAVLSTAFLCAVFGTASLGSGSTSTGFKPSPKQTIAPNPRPREAWVLRSVLDSKPRILSIALHNLIHGAELKIDASKEKLDYQNISQKLSKYIVNDIALKP